MIWDKRSPRKARLPQGWNKIREQVLARDPLCLIGYVGCSGRSTEVDHVARGDDHSLDNLQGACRHCHAIKSSQEGTAVQRAQRQQRQRPRPPHPGLRREP